MEVTPEALKNIKALSSNIEKKCVTLNSLISEIVEKHSKPLDEYMEKVDAILLSGQPATDKELEDITLSLPVLLYFVGEAQEAAGLKEDIAKAVRMEKYNNYHAGATGTVSDKQAQAELATQEEFIVHSVYNRVYKQLKIKMEQGNELLQSAKKIISRRMVEYELARVNPERIGAR